MSNQLKPIVLNPFEDGTVIKFFPRDADPNSTNLQQVVVNLTGDVLAIAKDASVAAMICDGVNVMFVALTKRNEMEASLKENLRADLAKLRQGTDPTTS